MRATLTNLSPLPREHWAVVTFPRVLAATFGPECVFVGNDGREFRAVRGRTVGLKTVYRIRAYLGGSETLSGRLENRRSPTEEAYRFHTWVSDDFAALVPSLGARVADVDRWDRDHSGPVLIDSSAAHTRWALRRWLPECGLIFEWWADIFHDDPVMPVWGKVIWSDRRDPNPNKAFQFLAIKSRELIAFDFSRRHGSGEPIRDAMGQWAVVLNSSVLNLNDGGGLPLSGNMLAFVSPGANDRPGDPEDRTDPVVKGIRDLHAGAFGPIFGVCLEWGGRWLAAGNVPRFREGIGYNTEAVWNAFVAQQEQVAGWFTDRPIGIGKTPGQTGDQEDFGATKGTMAVQAGDPRWLRIAQYAVHSELFRGFNHYEQNGTPLNLDAHPQWVTWSGVTHYHPGVSQDRLGKTSSANPGSGWYGYDDEHRSQNNLAAYMMLTDDPLAEDQLRHLTTTDRASYRMRFPTYGSGAARAQGRTSGAWAQFLTVTDGPDRQHWLNILAARMHQSLNLNSAISVAGPMKVLSWGGPDPRKQVYKLDNTLGPWVSFWEHGLAAVGLYNAAKANPGNADGRELLLRICRTLAQFAFFQHEGMWYTVADCLWSDGAAPPGEMVPTNKAFVSAPGAGDVNSWTFAGLLVAREVLATDPETQSATLARLSAYINGICGGQEAGNVRTAEWWAIVRDVTFPPAP